MVRFIVPKEFLRQSMTDLKQTLLVGRIQPPQSDSSDMTTRCGK